MIADGTVRREIAGSRSGVEVLQIFPTIGDTARRGGISDVPGKVVGRG
jgi:hypothetical protein